MSAKHTTLGSISDCMEYSHGEHQNIFSRAFVLAGRCPDRTWGVGVGSHLF